MISVIFYPHLEREFRKALPGSNYDSLSNDERIMLMHGLTLLLYDHILSLLDQDQSTTFVEIVLKNEVDGYQYACEIIPNLEDSLIEIIASGVSLYAKSC